MARSPCCDPDSLKRGPWTSEEDRKLVAYIQEHGHGSWSSLPQKAGLKRCGKSCRLRWTNYLRPDIKRGKFSLQEEQTMIQLHALLGNRWSTIATFLPKRTDNEIKNYWNTHLKKRLAKMGVDPVTHKPKSAILGSAGKDPKNASNLSHMAQWESTRLEAEARLVRELKLGQPQPGSSGSQLPTKMATTTTPPRCLDILKVWQDNWSCSTKGHDGVGGGGTGGASGDGLVNSVDILQRCLDILKVWQGILSESTQGNGGVWQGIWSESKEGGVGGGGGVRISFANTVDMSCNVEFPTFMSSLDNTFAMPTVGLSPFMGDGDRISVADDTVDMSCNVEFPTFMSSLDNAFAMSTIGLSDFTGFLGSFGGEIVEACGLHHLDMDMAFDAGEANFDDGVTNFLHNNNPDVHEERNASMGLWHGL